ncbi:hypothetical protein PB01_11595 [Psychrobacillus glaciei]|uniref:Uncharacterized protein n=1 Tax=Psychrobacillus glaciei TaxID=2283160 RepID=A0A5J6SNA4_9BACI|nr:hypothetical protein [Psychrobacillus glaciei]QFF99416.1 hypothetical protein PB01_11595 [Psychrobacillus glaciei]
MKLNGLSVSTSFVAALLCIFFLKMMEFFHFIKWNPIGYADKLEVFSKSKDYWKWIILFIGLWCFCIILYYISLIFIKIPVSISSLALGIILAVALEWLFLDKISVSKTIKHLSIPFICIVVMLLRFLMESAIFHMQDNPLSK